jgi:hypothetical protein
MTMHDSEPGRTTVVDDNIGDYSKTQLFFRLAIGYADTSYHSVQSMLAGSLPSTFAHAQAMHFLFEHAVELFLKGAICKSTGEIKITHNLERSYHRYRNLYPKKTFELSGRILDMVKTNPNSPHSEFPRFPTDTCGNVWRGYNAYTLEEWRTEIEHFRNDLERLIPEIDPLPQVPFEA